MIRLCPTFSTRTLLSLAILLLPFSNLWARRVEDWPYQKLLEQSHLVVIASVQTSVATSEKWQEKYFAPERFTALKTTFRVNAVLKGSATETIDVLHFKYSDKKTPYQDGPTLVSFDKEAIVIMMRKDDKSQKHDSAPSHVQSQVTDHLLFLKKTENGRYEPVSGQTDPSFSVRTLLYPTITVP